MKKYTIGLYEKAMPNALSLKEKLECAKKAGFDFVELSIDETDEKLQRLDMSKEERAEILQAGLDVGVSFGSICLSGHRKYPLGSENPETAKKAMEIMERAIILASDLGIRIIQLAGYDVYYEESNEKTIENFKKNLKISTDIASAYGVMLGFEIMETEFMNTCEKCMEYVNLINSPYLSVYPDTGNVTNANLMYGTDTLKDFECAKGHIVAMHLKESVPGKFREIEFGTGHVDFESILELAYNELGVKRYVTELWHTDDNWYDALVFAKNMMSDILERQA